MRVGGSYRHHLHSGPYLQLRKELLLYIELLEDHFSSPLYFLLIFAGLLGLYLHCRFRAAVFEFYLRRE